QETVETRGIASEVKIEEVIFGHLTELNGSSNYAPANSRLPQTATSEYIITLVPEFDMFFPARIHLLREVRRRSIKLATIFLKQATSRTLRRIRQTCRLAC